MQRTLPGILPGGAHTSGAFVVRVPHSRMSYEDNLKRMHSEFVKHSPVQYEMHQLYLDCHPIGGVVTAEKAVSLHYWLATALPDLEKVFRSASRDAASSRKPHHHG